MSNDCIAVHLTNLQTTLCATSRGRLMRTLLLTTLPTGLPLVLHHVLQAHSIDRSNEDRRLDLLARGTIVHHLITILLKAHIL